MSTMIDLKKSIVHVLKTNFPLIVSYSAETKEGFKIPSFSTQIVPLIAEYEIVNYSSNRTMIVINYFSQKGTELENLKMYDDIKKAFGMTLVVGRRSFLIRNFRSDIVNQVLQTKFDLEYLSF